MYRILKLYICNYVSIYLYKYIFTYHHIYILYNELMNAYEHSVR